MKYAFLLTLLMLSLAANVFLVYKKYNSPPPAKPTNPVPRSGFQYLSEQVKLDNRNDTLINFTVLRSNLKDYLDKNAQDKIGMYFQYLPTGISVGLNDKETFTEASLIKVPVAMAIYKKIEEGSLSEDAVLTLQKKDLDSAFGTLWEAGAGSKVTVDNAMYQMLVKSDNTASRVLRDKLDSKDIEDIYMQVDIPYQADRKFQTISPFNYSSLLKSLYFASYITPEHSEKILNTLTQTEYTDKIVAGVPKNIKVAHKIGIFDVPETDLQNYRAYSDCGIFYIPRRPYILCMMMRSDEKAANQHMKAVSQMIYDYITKQ